MIVGGGHNGLVAAAYLARAGRSVLVLERREHVGGAAVSERPWPGVDARLSRYSYLVSLLPRRAARASSALDVELRRRAVSSYTPRPDGSGLLVRTGEPPDTTPGGDFYAMTARVARRVFPTLTEPLLSRERAARRAWATTRPGRRCSSGRWARRSSAALRRRPRARDRAHRRADRHVRRARDDPSLRQNRCFLYHVIGNGDGRLGRAGRRHGRGHGRAGASWPRGAGAELRCGVEVTAIDPARAEVRWDGGAAARRARAGQRRARTCSRGCWASRRPAPAPEGAQLKLNMLLTRLPRLRDPRRRPARGVRGHLPRQRVRVAARRRRTRRPTRGRAPGAAAVRDLLPLAHRPDDPRAGAAGRGRADADLLRPAHAGAAVPATTRPARRRAPSRPRCARWTRVLAEPIEDCLWRTADGEPCLEARTPVELEAELGLPGGQHLPPRPGWPFAETETEVGTWGVETAHPRVLLCGAGARRGGGVSGIPGPQRRDGRRWHATVGAGEPDAYVRIKFHGLRTRNRRRPRRRPGVDAEHEHYKWWALSLHEPGHAARHDQLGHADHRAARPRARARTRASSRWSG